MNKNNLLGLGTAAFGRPLYINIKPSKESYTSEDSFMAKGIEILDRAYDLGIRSFDTSPGYGLAEKMLATWAHQKSNKDIEILTKWGYTYVANFDKNASVHEIKEHTLEKLNEQWEISKFLLPYLKAYQIHSATLETGVLNNETILHRLAELKYEHNLTIGITTTGANQKEVLEKAMGIEIDGLELFSLFQVTYNIFDQSISSLVNIISKNDKKIIIKEAMANGRVFPNKLYSNYRDTYKYLILLAKKYNVGVDAIALRFCAETVPAYRILSGANSVSHLSDNLKMNRFKLTEEEISFFKERPVNPSNYWNERKELKWN